MAVPAGSIRFNTDSAKMEIYNGDKWWNIDSTSPNEQTSGTRGLFASGLTPSLVDTIEYINVDSTGDAVDFGNLGAAARGIKGLASRTRGVWCGGYEPGYADRIQFATITSTGDTTDFGDLAQGGNNGQIDYLGACASATRGVFGGGQTPTKIDTIQYVTIATTGNATDFGDMNTGRKNFGGFSDAHGGLGE